jgi:hypothetical protein
MPHPSSAGRLLLFSECESFWRGAATPLSQLLQRILSRQCFARAPPWSAWVIQRTTARGPVRLMGHANENTPSTCKCSTISCRQFGRHWLDRPKMEGFWKPRTKMLILGQPRSRTFLSESTTWHFKHFLSRWKPCNQTNQQRARRGMFERGEADGCRQPVSIRVRRERFDYGLQRVGREADRQADR